MKLTYIYNKKVMENDVLKVCSGCGKVIMSDVVVCTYCKDVNESAL